MTSLARGLLLPSKRIVPRPRWPPSGRRPAHSQDPKNSNQPESAINPHSLRPKRSTQARNPAAASPSTSSLVTQKTQSQAINPTPPRMDKLFFQSQAVPPAGFSGQVAPPPPPIPGFPSLPFNPFAAAQPPFSHNGTPPMSFPTLQSFQNQNHSQNQKHHQPPPNQGKL